MTFAMGGVPHSGPQHPVFLAYGFVGQKFESELRSSYLEFLMWM